MTARDVTERLIRERTQRENESLLGAILETCGVGLCLWDHRHRFVSCNRAFCELTGFRPEELVGRPLAKVLSSEEIDRAQSLFAELLSGGGKGHGAVASSIELRCRRKDGGLVDVAIAASVLLRDEGRRFVVGSVMDISERKEKQLELIERAIDKGVSPEQLSKLIDLQERIKAIYLDELIEDYIVSLVTATRNHEDVYLGASARGSPSRWRSGATRTGPPTRTPSPASRTSPAAAP